MFQNDLSRFVVPLEYLFWKCSLVILIISKVKETFGILKIEFRIFEIKKERKVLRMKMRGFTSLH